MERRHPQEALYGISPCTVGSMLCLSTKIMLNLSYYVLHLYQTPQNYLITEKHAEIP